MATGTARLRVGLVEFCADGPWRKMNRSKVRRRRRRSDAEETIQQPGASCRRRCAIRHRRRFKKTRVTEDPCATGSPHLHDWPVVADLPFDKIGSLKTQKGVQESFDERGRLRILEHARHLRLQGL